MKLKAIIILAILGLQSCKITQSNSRYQLANGYYKSKVFNLNSNKIFIDNSDDTVSVYLIPKGSKFVDTNHLIKKTFPQVTSSSSVKAVTFKQGSLDIDFLTIPFKYRPSQKQFPRQFNTNLNGAVYFGYRNDIYQIRYAKQPIHNFSRETRHYGFSYGIFTGLGGTTMNPSVTNNQIISEYDGVVWSKGVAGIVGINNVTIGLAFGFDNLMDPNKKLWIYQSKPWLGLAFGLNIN